MDAVYGTKRYLRSLMGTSDIYGSPNSRITHNEMNNSYGYRSAMNTSEMSKYPYYNEFSQPNQYGYNNWGMWREQSIAPSVYSSKSRHEVKSFSIILSTAAFIVIVAVISVAGLAFYFGTFKSNLDEPVMMFEGNFHIMKGDVYTTALKYNHSSTYRQKVDFYERFIEKSLRDNDLQPVKVEILGFGDGPLINTNFRTFLDIRKVPINIRSVEEHIREAILYQTNSPKSLYKSIRVDPDTISVKRVLDDEKIKSALFIMTNKEDETSNHLKKSKPSLIKSPSPTLITTARAKIVKSTTNHVEEPTHSPSNSASYGDDIVPAPASNSFEGSFEITKTDADITRKKTVPTKAVASKKTTHTTTRLKSKTKPTVEKVYKSPINTTLSMLVKPASMINESLKPTVSQSTTVTKVTTHAPKTTIQTTKFIPTLKTKTVPTVTTRRTTIRPITTTTPTTTSSSTITTTTTTTAKPTKKLSPTKNLSTTPYNGVSSKVVAFNEEFLSKDLNVTTKKEPDVQIAQNRENFNPPRLDVHLFTTSPVLDTEPWRPIRPPIPTTPPFNVAQSSALPNINSVNVAQSSVLPNTNTFNVAQSSALPNTNSFNVAQSSALPNINSEESKQDFTEHLKNIKNKTSTSTTKDSDLMFYHSFTNPVFMPNLSGIERLGNSVVKAHPIPVRLLDDIVVPNFKPVQHDDNMLSKFLQKAGPTQDLFEEIGGGVMLRKPSNPNKNKTLEIKSTTSIKPTTIVTSTTPKTITEEQIVQKNEESPKDDKSSTDEEPIVPAAVKNDTQNITAEAKTESLSLPEEKLSTKTTKPANIIPEKGTKPPKIIPEKGTKTKNITLNNFTDTEGRNKQSSILASEHQRPLKEPTKTEVLDSSLLFPTITKWEYSNGTVEKKPTHSSVKKIFNETLQAWVVRNNVENEHKNLSMTNITTENRPKGNIQDISLIFDNLASKLGISTGSYSRKPPFSANRLKQSSRIDSRTPTTSTVTTPTTSTTQFIPEYMGSGRDDGFVPIISASTERIIEKKINMMQKENQNDSSSSSSGEKIEGEAEVEVVDPNIYDEILRYSQVLTSSTESTIPTLMTLLPVKSNSGIRPIHSGHMVGHVLDESPKSYTNTNFREATVRDTISVTN